MCTQNKYIRQMSDNGVILFFHKAMWITRINVIYVKKIYSQNGKKKIGPETFKINSIHDIFYI